MKSIRIYIVIINDEFERPIIKGVYQSKENAKKRMRKLSTFINEAQIYTTTLRP